MRKLIIVAAGMALIATSAWNRLPRETPPTAAIGTGMNKGIGTRAAMVEAVAGTVIADIEMRESDDEDQATGARFVLRSGDTRLSVVCASRESTRTCVDAALMLFDRVRSQQGGTASTTPPAPVTPSAPPANR